VLTSGKGGGIGYAARVPPADIARASYVLKVEARFEHGYRRGGEPRSQFTIK